MRLRRVHLPAAPWLRRTLVLCAAAAVGACAHHAPVEMTLVNAEVAAVWPAPPDVPRYRYVGELIGEDNFASGDEGPGAATRFLRWVVGLTSGKRQRVELQRPQGVWVDAEGRVYVTDVSRQGIYVFDPVAKRLRVWDEARKGGRFRAPIGITGGPNGELLVADAELGVVVRLDREGRPLGLIGTGELQWPTGVAYDPGRSRLYVADTHAHDIKVFDDGGTRLFAIGRRGEAPGEFNGPTYLAFAGDSLYVTDTLNTRVQVLSPEGEVRRVFGRRGLYLGDMPRPKGVAVGPEGEIYVVESYYDYLLVFNAQGQFLLPLGGSGSGVGQFYQPAGAWADPTTERVYVADMLNGRVVIFQYLGGA